MKESHELLRERTDWQTLLREYRQREETARIVDPESDGWIPRLDAVEELEPENLSRLHGELIAHNYLKFDLTDAAHGLRYRITSECKQQLDRPTEAA